MEKLAAVEETTLKIERTFAAPVERVWRAFTVAADLERWYALSDEWGPTSAEVDLRVGGRYRFTLRPDETRQIVESGEFREVIDRERLVYSCELADTGGDVGHEETIVTIEFREIDQGTTQITLTQTGFPTQASRNLHGGGWSRFLDRLDADLNA